MKKCIATLLLSTAFVLPAYAADADKAPAKKPGATSMKDKSSKNKDDCDHAHGRHMGHHGHGGAYGHGGGAYGGHGYNVQYGLRGLDLSKDQQDKINRLTDDLQRSNWKNQGDINEESIKLRDLYAAEKRDANAISAVYERIFDIKRKMIVDDVNTRNNVLDVLTTEQKAKLKEAHRGSRG